MTGPLGDWKYAAFRWPDDPTARPPDSQELVDLRRQNEIRLGQPVHGVRPGGDFDLAPSQQNVGMVALLLGDLAHFIHESQRRLEIGELEASHDVVLVHDFPLCGIGKLTMEFGQFGSLERRHAAAAGNAVSIRKLGTAQVETPRTECLRP